VKLIKVFDQGEPFATILANEDQVDDYCVRLRATWGTDEDSLFEIQVGDPDDIDTVVAHMEDGSDDPDLIFDVLSAVKRGAPGCTCGTPPFAPPEPASDCPFHA
jgi:hypothetical protein